MAWRQGRGERWRRRASLLLMFASGMAGLGYQIVWTQQSTVWLGHESAAVLAVVAAFFGGLALGALILGPRIEASERPVHWYAGCELLIASWSVVLALAMSPFSAWMLRMTGVQPTAMWQWLVAFCGTFLILLPATAAMGATLPAMERVIGQMHDERRSIAALYASNTLGAVLGVLAAAFWLVPTLGLVHTAGVCAVLNLLCGAIALLAFSNRAPASSPAQLLPAAHGALLRLTVTGLLGIGYEVLVVRVLSQVAEDTVYTFAMLLATYLVGTAAGAAAYQRWLARSPDAAKLGDQLLCALAMACLLGTATLWSAEHVQALALAWFGASMSAALAAEAVLGLIAFGPATVVMGAVFSHLSAHAQAAGVTFGRAVGVNTLGAAAAPLVFGVLVLAAVGPKLALVLIGVGYLMLVTPRAWLSPIVGVPAAAALALAIWAPPLTFVEVPEGGHIVSYDEGIIAAVSVVEDAEGVARLRINNRQQEGSSSTLRVDGRQGVLPILLHPAPRHALFLGLGTGITASTAVQQPVLQVDAVELLPEVITASRHFTHALSDEVPIERLHLINADARRYVRASERRYDVIVSDNFHPARSGSGSLYTVEHFAAVRDRLAAGGIFCQWLPLHQLDLQTLRSIVHSFVSVYPGGWAVLASNSLETPVLGLVGKADASRFDVAVLHARMADATAERLIRLGLEDELAVLGSFIAGPQALRSFAAGSPLNTDDHPVVAYRAPRITYAPDSLPRDRLIELLQELSIHPSDLIAATPDAESSRRLAAYWAARDRFIESGRNIRPSQDPRDMLAQVREPLLSVLHISPDFRPAYDPLLLMAKALTQTDAAAARTLLTNLAQVQPARSEASLVLAQMNEQMNEQMNAASP